MSEKPTVIIKKVKKIQGGGHHGGAWKVAYADFVTAMMAFFLLMWLISMSSESTLQGVAEYFTPTESISDKAGLGFDGGADTSMEEGSGAPNSTSSSLIFGSPSRGHRVDPARKASNISEVERDHFINIMNNIQQDSQLQQYSENLHIDLTDEGLRIQIMDSNNRPVFKPNTSELQPYIIQMLNVIGKMIKDQPNYISLSGHTAAIMGDISSDEIDLWDISSDRANTVRKYLEDGLIKGNQVVRIVGRADKEPFNIKDPSAPQNIRVGITLLNEDSVAKHLKSAPQ